MVLGRPSEPLHGWAVYPPAALAPVGVSWAREQPLYPSCPSGREESTPLRRAGGNASARLPGKGPDHSES